MLYELTGSLVAYKNEATLLQSAINSFLDTNLSIMLYIIDNSPTDALKGLFHSSNNIKYIHNPSNPGFGGAHNEAMKLAMSAGSKYHFIINPDTYFTGDVITPMVNYMKQNANVGMLMPQILNTDGSIQNLPKLLPTPYSIFLRKFKWPLNFYTKFINKYELRSVPKDLIYKAPILSGCFTLLRLQAIKEVGGYDDKFFMYFEDWDLSRRMNTKYDTVYFPKVSVFHGYESGANKSSHLLKIYLKSYMHFFNKWGWFFDHKRRLLNLQTLDQFKS